MLPPQSRASSRARSRGTSSRAATKAAASSSSGGWSKKLCTRLRMVGSSCSAERHSSRNTPWAGGSSMSLSSLFWAGSRGFVPICRMYTLTSASSGAR